MLAKYIKKVRKQKAENRKQKRKEPKLAVVTSAVPLNKSQEKQVAAWVKRNLGEVVELKTQIDPRVIAGIRVRAGDWLFDGTFKGELSRAKQALIAG